jgi:hypothetical protein
MFWGRFCKCEDLCAKSLCCVSSSFAVVMAEAFANQYDDDAAEESEYASSESEDCSWDVTDVMAGFTIKMM